MHRDSCGFSVGSRCFHIEIMREIIRDECANCPHYSGRLRGVGDIVHAVARATGVSAVVGALPFDCGCADRRAALNAALPFPDKPTSEP